MAGQHEHVFHPHTDPRWLVCDCGQYAARTQTRHGQASFRLIDPPRSAFTASATAATVPPGASDVRDGEAVQPA